MRVRESIPPLAATATLVFTIGCGSSGRPPPPAEKGSSPTSVSDVPDAPILPAADNEACEDGDVRECRVEHSINEGVESCFTGLTVCVDGAWSPCVDENRAEVLLFGEE